MVADKRYERQVRREFSLAGAGRLLDGSSFSVEEHSFTRKGEQFSGVVPVFYSGYNIDDLQRHAKIIDGDKGSVVAGRIVLEPGIKKGKVKMSNFVKDGRLLITGHSLALNNNEVRSRCVRNLLAKMLFTNGEGMNGYGIPVVPSYAVLNFDSLEFLARPYWSSTLQDIADRAHFSDEVSGKIERAIGVLFERFRFAQVAYKPGEALTKKDIANFKVYDVRNGYDIKLMGFPEFVEVGSNYDYNHDSDMLKGALGLSKKLAKKMNVSRKK
jgi:hypothetical protein